MPSMSELLGDLSVETVSRHTGRHLVNVDFQMQAVGLPGLKHYVIDPDVMPWESWPSCTINWDQGALQQP